MENTTNASSVLSKGIENSLRSWSDLTAEIERIAETGDVPEIYFRERDAVVDELLVTEPQSAVDLLAMCAALLHDGEGPDEAIPLIRDHARRLLGLPAIGAA